MDDETRDALDASIEKWRAIIRGDAGDLGASNCALCTLFLAGRSEINECWGCPVMMRTGVSGCENSPYVAWAQTFIDGPGDEFPRRADTPERVTLAEAELAFLESLRVSE